MKQQQQRRRQQQIQLNASHNQSYQNSSKKYNHGLLRLHERRLRLRQQQHLMSSNYLLLTIFFLVFTTFTTTTIMVSASTTSDGGLYHSVRELDKYGNSVQLRNAAECSNRYGSLVIAAIACPSSSSNNDDKEEETGIVICTLRPYRPGIKPKKLIEEECVYTIADNDISHDDDSNTILLAFIGSGLQPDSTLLLNLLRSYARRWWDRYDDIPSLDVMADVTRAVKLGFMSYDTSKEISSLGVGTAIESDDDDEEESKMSRPFGVTSLLFGVQSNGKMKIKSVHPNGVEASWVARAIGRHSMEANALLQRYWYKGMNVQQVKDMCLQIMREVLIGEEEEEEDNVVSSSPMWMKKTDIVCQVLTTRSATEKNVERFPLFVDKPKQQ